LLAVQAQGGLRDRSENSKRDAGVADATPPVGAVAHPGQRELDIGKSLSGAGGHQRMNFIQSSGRVPVRRSGPALGFVIDEMSKLFNAKVALSLEFFAKGGQVPGKPAISGRAQARRWSKRRPNHVASGSHGLPSTMRGRYRRGRSCLQPRTS
jgi:hypothetical protein